MSSQDLAAALSLARLPLYQLLLEPWVVLYPKPRGLLPPDLGPVTVVWELGASIHGCL